MRWEKLCGELKVYWLGDSCFWSSHMEIDELETEDSSNQ